MLTLIGTRLTILALRKRVQPIDLSQIRNKRLPSAPSGGGIVISFVLVICLVAADISYGIMLAMLLLIAVSLLHSIINIPVIFRVLVQAMAVAIPLNTMDSGLFSVLLPAMPDKILTGAAWIWFMHMFTSLDKTDGLCAIEAICICGAISMVAVFAGVFPSELSIYSLITASAIIGFLWWNWAPAKIRMGEVGSIPIGFILGYLLMQLSAAGYSYATAIIPAVILSDGIITHLKKIVGSNPKTPYYFERAMHHGRSAGGVGRYIIGTNILLAFLAIQTLLDADLSIVYTSLAYLCVFMLLGFFAYTRSVDSDETV